MTTLAIACSSVHKKVQKKVSTALFFEINWKIVCFIGFMATCSLLIMYAFLVNDLTGGTYTVKNYERKIAELVRENRNLEVGFAKTGVMENIQQKISDLNFERTSSVKYIQVLDSSLAKAK